LTHHKNHKPTKKPNRRQGRRGKEDVSPSLKGALRKRFAIDGENTMHLLVFQGEKFRKRRRSRGRGPKKYTQKLRGLGFFGKM